MHVKSSVYATPICPATAVTKAGVSTRSQTLKPLASVKSHQPSPVPHVDGAADSSTLEPQREKALIVAALDCLGCKVDSMNQQMNEDQGVDIR